MKKYVALLLLLLSAGANCQNASTSIDSALIVCYPFSGNANDMSGHNLHGTVNGATLVSDRFGNPNAAYSFGGSSNPSNIIVSGFSSQLNGTGVSISFWTNKTVNTYDAAFLMSPDDAGNRLAICPYYSTTAYWDYGNISASGRLSANSPLPASNVWDHWVFVSNQSTNTMKIYKNGSALASQTVASTFSTTPLRDLLIGSGVGANNGQLWYTGKLDDIRIYKREILAAEVSYLYSSSSACTPCPAVPTPSSASTASSLCFGSSATLSAVGSSSLQWYSSLTSTFSLGSGANFSPPSSNAPGTYTYYVRAFNSCSTGSALAMTYTVKALPALQVTQSSSFVCVGQTAQLLGTGATNYTWLPGSTASATLTISPLATTAYTLKGEANGCVSTTAIVMPVINLPAVAIANSSTLVCAGTTASLTASGATNYSWQPGNAQTAVIAVSPLSTTAYTVTGEAGGCTNTAVITVPVVNLPAVSISGSSLICAGKTALLLASGATNYTWWPGNTQSQVLSVSPASTTTYAVTGETGGCSNTAVITMSVASPPALSVAPFSASICTGAQASFTVSGASTYSWSTGSTAPVLVVSPVFATNYIVTGTDVNNCSSSTMASVFVYSLSFVNVTSTSSLICAGEPVDLVASGVGTYTWSTGAQSSSISVSPTVMTTYSVTGTDTGTGCQYPASYVQNVSACTALQSQGGLDPAFQLYPNPTTGRLVISTEVESEVIICNSLGDVVYRSKHKGISEISLEHLSIGVYIVTLRVDQKGVMRKLIKQ